MIERRKHKRFDMPLKVSVEKQLNGDALVESTELHNISIGGALFAVRQNIRVGDELQIDLHDEESRFASALGLDTSDSGPLRFSVDCKVLRKIIEQGDSPANLVAVKFSSPLRIKRIDEMAANRQN